MNRCKVISLLLVFIIVVTGCSFGDWDFGENAGEKKEEQEEIELSEEGNSMPEKTFKILHIMSYQMSWEWTESQFKGFQDAMADVNVDYEVFSLDAKNKSTKAWMEKAGEEARNKIQELKPDLVYTSDEEALDYVTKYFVNTETPFVFSGVNEVKKQYGFEAADNITGVLELEHFASSVELFKMIVGDVKKIIVVFDTSSIWEASRKRMKEQAREFPEIEFTFLEPIKTYKEYKEIVKENEGKVDGMCLAGIYEFKDDSGENVPYEEVLKWTGENSSIPDFSFWIDSINYGTLCGTIISGYEQGFAAGKMAKEILVNGKTPSDFPMTPTEKGVAAINLKRANDLNLDIDSKTLLSSTVINKYYWEE
ncbi:ABC transporter substrate-binding protein [Anaeromicropila populeti]|uniref:ABC-type uncharacterized transport system, substrate-binding protein n=1 Tax=Anaeromicropila populeti TaxID=37658 RepID=A0A1I6IAE8_9FIRM|nr:ABC transporter substrate binding protein [Anaeromicropila populeti]SFR63666.1 ABC-type uncharacterized transport system, substrate-binding protein [Anaeromicropila populeti]